MIALALPKVLSTVDAGGVSMPELIGTTELELELIGRGMIEIAVDEAMVAIVLIEPAAGVKVPKVLSTVEAGGVSTTELMGMTEAAVEIATVLVAGRGVADGATYVVCVIMSVTYTMLRALITRARLWPARAAVAITAMVLMRIIGCAVIDKFENKRVRVCFANGNFK